MAPKVSTSSATLDPLSCMRNDDVLAAFHLLTDPHRTSVYTVNAAVDVLAGTRSSVVRLPYARCFPSLKLLFLGHALTQHGHLEGWSLGVSLFIQPLSHGKTLLSQQGERPMGGVVIHSPRRRVIVGAAQCKLILPGCFRDFC